MKILQAAVAIFICIAVLVLGVCAILFMPNLFDHRTGSRFSGFGGMSNYERHAMPDNQRGVDPDAATKGRLAPELPPICKGNGC
jgi:hypothetical protein